MNQHLDEFCDHCAKKHGLNQNSFIGLAPLGSYAKVVCKGCGITQVDHQGHCLKCQTSKFNKSIIWVIIALFLIILFAWI